MQIRNHQKYILANLIRNNRPVVPAVIGLPPDKMNSIRNFCIVVSLAAVTAACQDANLDQDNNWEPAYNSVNITDEPISDSIEIISENEIASRTFAQRAVVDRSWYSSKGKRYKAMYIKPSGKAYGLVGDSTKWPAPNMNVGLGSTQQMRDTKSVQTVSDAVRQTEQSSKLTSADGPTSKARITTDWTIDRRSRRGSVTALRSKPFRMVGAMSGDGSTRSSSCTGTKIGPRAVLTAAHCVMDSDGNIRRSGWFNPGQTNTQTPNGSMRWRGVYLRDWRVHRKYDYAVVFLEDTAAAVNLGWLGVAYWNNAAGYAGRGASLHGYPCGPNNSCGEITEQRCKASPRTDKRCDGWMYSHSTKLWEDSFRNDHLLQYDHDMSSGQSGSAVYVQLSPGDRRVVAVNTHSWGGVSMGARFRASMWNDVCTWIAAVPSAFGSHGTCN